MVSSEIVRIENVEALQRLFHEQPHQILPVGNRTKLDLTQSSATGSTVMCDLSAWAGVTIYDPSEFLITAQAGTRLSDIQARLAEYGQFLPCDPPGIEAGATLGGAVASGLNGPGRLLYGSLRDFVMEVVFVDGLGNLVHGGGKVVKNAAGFDFPKLMVGSLGRMGVMTEITLKVLPKPQCLASCRLTLASLDECYAVSQTLLGQPLPIAAIDFLMTAPTEPTLQVRFAGPAASLPKVLERAKSLVDAAGVEGQWTAITDSAEEQRLWNERGFAGAQVRVGVDGPHLLELQQSLGEDAGIELTRCTGAGTEAWYRCSVKGLETLDHALSAAKLTGLKIPFCPYQLPLLGDRQWTVGATRVQRAMDPAQRFLAYN
ncbi:FAD-binding protein [Aureliella helgolandensis]|uniref:Putative FAD-linked oxidoreductase n=1 Tax=Aureliella helgolandensis TaxID=2527968 RepID=A0A518G0E7_9BACT|nr:FAD-binding protein [Aureliella helgolandensis]QDV22046.1 putative FAD-linked oxidoreductase [Aureliella helgolandensis]